MKIHSKFIGLALIIGLSILFVNAPVFAQTEKSCSGSCSDTAEVKAQDSCCGTCAGTACSDESAAFDFSATANCEICKNAHENMDLLMACDYAVADSKDGVVFTVHLNNPALLERFRAFQKRDIALTEKFKSACSESCSEKLCPMCDEYLQFVRSGLKEERIDTPNGHILLARADCPDLRENLHAWAGKLRKAMAAFDAQQLDATATAVAAAPAPKMPEAMLAEFKNCAVCSVGLEQPEMMIAAKPSVLYLKNGVAMTHTVFDQKQLKAFHAFERKFHDRVETLEKSGWCCPSSGNPVTLCSMCRKFGELQEHGAIIDWTETPFGSMTILVCSDPAVVKKIHALGKEMEQLCGSMQKESVVQR